MRNIEIPISVQWHGVHVIVWVAVMKEWLTILTPRILYTSSVVFVGFCTFYCTCVTLTAVSSETGVLMVSTQSFCMKSTLFCDALLLLYRNRYIYVQRTLFSETRVVLEAPRRSIR